jgi:hypothetical protein
MLSVVFEIRVQTKFTVAELATVITHWFIHDAAIVPVVAFQFDQFVIDADDQPGGHPLRYEITPLSTPGDLTEQGKRHGPNCHAQVG